MNGRDKFPAWILLLVSMLLVAWVPAEAGPQPRGERAIDVAFCMYHSEELIQPKTNEQWANMGQGCWDAVREKGPEWSQVWRKHMTAAGIDLKGLGL